MATAAAAVTPAGLVEPKRPSALVRQAAAKAVTAVVVSPPAAAAETRPDGPKPVQWQQWCPEPGEPNPASSAEG